jgi:branched-chain amino acid transport system ATP-binding protein
VLQIEAIHTYYGASHILQGMSLTVERGEVVAVIGRNGVGKTTLVAPSSG